VKESRATDIENRLIMLARTGQLRSKVTEDQLKELLEAIAENNRENEGGGSVVFNRRKGGWDDDDLDDLWMRSFKKTRKAIPYFSLLVGIICIM
jgi:programmed cell death protein 5